LLLPVFMRLAGPAAWYLPPWLDRILPDVRFGHGEAAPTDPKLPETPAKPALVGHNR
jgi:hypothetical protein